MSIKLSGASVGSTSHFRSSAMLVIPILENLNIRFYGRLQWHNVYTKYYPNPSSCSRVESCGQTDGERDTVSYIGVRLMPNVQKRLIIQTVP